MDGRDPGEREAQYRTLLETSTDGFFINVDGRFHYVNPAFVRLLGARSKEELLGRKVFERIAPESRALVRSRIEALRGSTDPVPPLEEKYLRMDGTTVDVEVTAVAVVEQERHAMLVTVRDITERRRAEQVERLLYEQLRQSQKLEALGTLAGGIAHDFNNVLAVIMANAQHARARLDEDAPARKNLDEILTAATRAKGVTRQVLAFGRPEPSRLEVIDLRATVLDELSLLRAAAPVGATIHEELPAEGVPVRADPTQIHQVLLNLCTNAWQSFEGRSGRVTIGLRVVERTGGEEVALTCDRIAELRVVDDGPGMDEDVRRRVFDPFFTTKGPHLGTGLGLSVVHGIVESHGAHIHCKSTPGGGTAFVVHLPIAPAHDHEARRAIPSAPRGRGQHILLLDDEPALVESHAELLRSQGYRVLGCSMPERALAALRDDPVSFDLLVTDLKMPGLTGLEVLERAHAIAPELSVVLVSGYLGDHVDRLASARGVAAVLHKPIDTAELFVTVARALGS